MPKTTLGKWSAGLNIVFLVIIAASLLLVLVFKTLSFDDTWWDVTVGITSIMEIIALVTGIVAFKNKDRSFLVYLSIGTGVCVILFALLHSLFISD